MMNQIRLTNCSDVLCALEYYGFGFDGDREEGIGIVNVPGLKYPVGYIRDKILTPLNTHLTEFADYHKIMVSAVGDIGANYPLI